MEQSANAERVNASGDAVACLQKNTQYCLVPKGARSGAGMRWCECFVCRVPGGSSTQGAVSVEVRAASSWGSLKATAARRRGRRLVAGGVRGEEWCEVSDARGDDAVARRGWRRRRGGWWWWWWSKVCSSIGRVVSSGRLSLCFAQPEVLV